MRSLLILAAALAACDAPAPDPSTLSVAPPPGTFDLVASPLSTGAPFTLSSRGAVSGARLVFFAGLNAGPGPCAGALCADLTQPFLLGTALSDAAGEASLALPRVPLAIPVGTTVYFQAVELGPVRAKSPLYQDVVGPAADCPAVDPNDSYYGRFEGISFDNTCTTSADCVVGGCSGEVCAAEGAFTTCELLPYLPGGDCGCVNNTCVWATACP